MDTPTLNSDFTEVSCLCRGSRPLSLGGDNRDRTDDPLLAKQVLSQLSYTPVFRLGFSLVKVRVSRPQKLNNDFDLGLMVFLVYHPDLRCLTDYSSVKSP